MREAIVPMMTLNLDLILKFIFHFLLHARRSALPSGEGFSPCEIFFENFARRVKKNILKKIFFQKTDCHDPSWPRLSHSHGFDSRGIKTLFSPCQRQSENKVLFSLENYRIKSARPRNPLGFMKESEKKF